MKAFEIADEIEKYCPIEISEKWDNVGFLIGDKNKEIKTVYITLDICNNSIKEAINNKADMIISHHPIFFTPIKRIDTSTPFGQTIDMIIKNDICVYSAHTNMDSSRIGINATLAKIFDIVNPLVLSPCENDSNVGIGRFGKMKNECSLSELCEKAKRLLKTPSVRVCGDCSKKIKTLAVASGSCAELIPDAIAKGIDAIITADMKYHDAKTYEEYGISIIDAGHYPTERLVVDIFTNLLTKFDLNLVNSHDIDVFKFV